MSRILITIFLPLLVYLSYQGCRNRGGWSPPPPQFLADQLTLSQPGGQVMPPTLLSAPRIFRPSYGPACSLAHFDVVCEIPIWQLGNPSFFEWT